MDDRVFSKEEAMDALMAAASGASGVSERGTTQEELEAVATEMGIDVGRLREVLARGTGTVQANDETGSGMGWPGRETFERTVNGELSEGAFAELTGELGLPLEPYQGGVKRAVGEYWSKMSYMTVEMTSRAGRTKLVARSKPSTRVLAPFYGMAGTFSFVIISAVAKKAPENLAWVVATVGFAVFVAWFLAGTLMRRNRGEVAAKMDRLAGKVKEELQAGGAVPVSESDELRNSLNQKQSSDNMNNQPRLDSLG